MPTDMKLPELGENIEGGDVLRVMVKASDTIKKDQAVLELETDKATIEVPSDVAGTVKDIKVKPGDTVGSGDVDAFCMAIVGTARRGAATFGAGAGGVSAAGAVVRRAATGATGAASITTAPSSQDIFTCAWAPIWESIATVWGPTVA